MGLAPVPLWPKDRGHGGQGWQAQHEPPEALPQQPLATLVHACLEYMHTQTPALTESLHRGPPSVLPNQTLYSQGEGCPPCPAWLTAPLRPHLL